MDESESQDGTTPIRLITASMERTALQMGPMAKAMGTLAAPIESVQVSKMANVLIQQPTSPSFRARSISRVLALPTELGPLENFWPVFMATGIRI